MDGGGLRIFPSPEVTHRPRTTVTDCSLRSGQLSGKERLMIDGGGWRVEDFSVAEGDTSSPDDRHRLSSAERKTVGGRSCQSPAAGFCARTYRHKKRSQPQ